MIESGDSRSDADQYFTVESVAEGEVKVKGSRFLAFVSPASDRKEADTFVATLSKKYHDAAHVCHAFRIGSDDFRTSDAGEPSGTAGRPILEALIGEDLLYTVCAVVRYFGGVKLGRGGLSRAYSEAAKAALKHAKKTEKWLTVPMRISFPYDSTGVVRSLLAKYNCSIDRTEFGDGTGLVFRIRKSRQEFFRNEIADATRGQANIDVLEPTGSLRRGEEKIRSNGIK